MWSRPTLVFVSCSCYGHVSESSFRGRQDLVRFLSQCQGQTQLSTHMLATVEQVEHDAYFEPVFAQCDGLMEFKHITKLAPRQ